MPLESAAREVTGDEKTKRTSPMNEAVRSSAAAQGKPNHSVRDENEGVRGTNRRLARPPG